MTLGEGGPPCPLVSVGFRWFPLVFFRWPTLATLYIEHAREQGGHPSRFFFLLGFSYMNVAKNLCGFSLADFPTFPIYYITFVAGQVGRHIQWVVRWGDFKKNPPSQSIILLS